MIDDYRDQEGYVSLWVGNCSDYETLDNYLSTVYPEENVEMQKKLRGLFLPTNQNRPCEQELRDTFSDEYYNQFEYDFGLSFDEDFREAEVLETKTTDLKKLFDGFSYFDTFLNEAKALKTVPLVTCNAAVALYDFKYCGDILDAEHEHIGLHFLGYVKYSK